MSSFIYDNSKIFDDDNNNRCFTLIEFTVGLNAQYKISVYRYNVYYLFIEV